LPAVLRAFGEEHPSADVSLHELLLDQLQEIADGRVDVAFSRFVPSQVDDERITIDILGEDPRLLVVPRDHRLAERSSVRMEELDSESFVVNPSAAGTAPARWLTEQRRHGLNGRVAAEAASVQELLTLVAAGQGVSLVPGPVVGRYPRDDVRYIPVEDAEAAVVSIAHLASGQRPIIESFIETARRLAATATAPPQVVDSGASPA
jgi:DNA-binding transcriptional LysR family regulator